jgi:hypothetical protein
MDKVSMGIDHEEYTTAKILSHVSKPGMREDF